MFIVGLTGGIASGKSAAATLFENLGIDIIDADVIARTVVEPNTPALKEIITHFSPSILLSDNSLNRAALRQRIFESDKERGWLENLLHPVIRQEIIKQIEEAKSTYTILVSPLLLETNQHTLCDRIVVIDVEEKVQIERACQRDNNKEAQIKKIIATQIPRKERLAKADDIIHNNQDMSNLKDQVEKLHNVYLKMIK